MMRVDLPGGQWADLKELDDLIEDDRQAARKALSVVTDDDGNMELNAGMGDAMRNAVMAQVITGWSFEGKPLPKDLPGVIGSLPIATARALRKATKDHYELIWADDDADPTAGSAS
jgi:hypothetical protein